MKHVVIIEDEDIAAQHLKKVLKEVLPQSEVDIVLQSIEESVEYFKQIEGTDNTPDIVFMDIHLADGSSFRIFDHIDVPYPIIFTTAYDEYALDAFKVNSIDYLLKPINITDLQRAIHKLEQLSPTNTNPQIDALLETIRQRLPDKYKSHFLITVHNRLIPIEVDNIACVYVEDKITYAIFYDGKHQTIDRSLDAIMEILNPDFFFRANRQFIVSHRSIKEISVYPISRLALNLCVPTPDRIIVSKTKAQEFKQWYTK